MSDLLSLMTTELLTEKNTQTEEKNNEEAFPPLTPLPKLNLEETENPFEQKEEKPLWEKCVDFYNNHKTKIMGVTLVGSLLYSGYNMYKVTQLSNELQSMSKANIKDMRELERRIEENRTVLKKMDEENSKINMWFAQTPKLPKPKNVNGAKNRRC